MVLSGFRWQTFDRNTLGSNGSFLSRFIARPPFALAHLKTQAILQHRSKKGQSAFHGTTHLSRNSPSDQRTAANSGPVPLKPITRLHVLHPN
jgi:hypothetical protein